ncbi:MAG TPA: hypothetical protein VIV82_08330 [Verrucomicrobiae bacterium]|jgi:hypothetical protein
MRLQLMVSSLFLTTAHSHEFLREVFQKTSAKKIAADLGFSLSLIHTWAESDDGLRGFFVASTFPDAGHLFRFA